ncbi:carboxylesterase [Aureobasidium subglaciale]|nr:carboxylesterase [Aureobasidium subglaciale]
MPSSLSAVLLATLLPSCIYASSPIVTIRNGTVQGRHSAQWNQDFFLGIPYAQPPVGDLRFKWPQAINSSFEGVFDASHYGHSCYQYGSNFNLSEDCLTINGRLIRVVVRPAGHEHQKLPVLVWIYGGGLTLGSTADPQYNLSGIVEASTLTDNPFIAVSMNYRLGVWGFLNTPVVHAEGSSNAGLLDQRLALRWVQDNIVSFGGDPYRVTVWGESAGAQSIGIHLTSYNGRNDNLFQAAILESGGPEGASLNTLSFYSAATDNLTRTVGCPRTWTSPAQLACLRNLSSEALFASNYTVVWNPIVDGDFLTDYPSALLAQNNSIRVPLLTGANTDEGVSFSVQNLNTTTDVYNSLFYWRNYALSPASIRKLLQLYPNNPAAEPPYSNHANVTYPAYGAQWRRSAAIGGDLVMIAQRRRMAKLYANAGEKVFSYRFDTPLYNATVPGSVKHFDNVMFSFQNISGAMGPLPQYQHYKALSTGIGKLYANFVGTHNPNGMNTTNGTGLPEWPQYSIDSPTNLVLNATASFVEADTFRKQGISFINSIWRELLA